MFKLFDIRSTVRSISTVAIVLAALAGTNAPVLAENPIKVDLDYARVIKLDRPISRVIIGNADIADATVSDPKTIILTGKSFGTTNLVILDNDGNAIVDERVLVSLEAHNTMQVYRQVERQIMSCTPACEPLDLER
ncbi:pilus assembly protein N-terminal domain-containing protein [Hoeflea prorocentri]|uniref:Pilus assembly protein N-terminal domain-containing protein n=1 Tax=Hoeflea prorocentri TaxID=1922333 RepID=A0A9X3ULD1_9HYPH|nr:pilus assembly protein N-terminal domain-containing protein [Hoeflea prorocentri]MCY6382975.1 pilus assembly protein N-terminal domain-containing protein [Hoeflea prorocentri]MDA5400775.1 pilus assembly protein N-terminal domain-containing protein [Hoeflea prorocentri]